MRLHGHPRAEWSPDPFRDVKKDMADHMREATAWDWVALSNAARAFSRRWVHCVDDARDVAQDALVQLLTAAGTVREPLPWLFVTTRRIAARRQRGERELLVDVADIASSIQTTDDTLNRVLFNWALNA